MSALDDADVALRTRPLVDAGQLLKPGGVRELEQLIARLGAADLSAHLVITPRGEPLGPWHALWTRQGYQPARDLLLLFNGQRWEARGWNLSPAAVNSALAAAEPALRQYYGKGLAAALNNLAQATGRAPEAAPEPAPRRGSSAVGGVATAIGLTAAAALVGWVIVRRRKLAQERRQSLTQARSSADQVFADVLLATEEMSDPVAAQLRDKATRLHEELESLAPTGVKMLPAKEEKVTLARLQQVENELEALRSSVLQVRRR